MLNCLRSMLLFLGASTLAAASAYAASNSLVIVVANGPLAGTYKPSEPLCVHSKQQRGYSVAWIDIKPNGARALAQATMDVSPQDGSRAKSGNVYIEFGDSDKNTVKYSFVDQPLTFAFSGGVGTFAFDGKTKEGVQLHVTASCADISEV